MPLYSQNRCYRQRRLVIIEARCVECGQVWSRWQLTDVAGPGTEVDQILCLHHRELTDHQVIEQAAAYLGYGGADEGTYPPHPPF